MKETHDKKATITTAFALILLAADTTFMRFVEYLDEYGELDFTHSMFIFGTILGVVYLLLEIAAALWRKPAANWLAALLCIRGQSVVAKQGRQQLFPSRDDCVFRVFLAD